MSARKMTPSRILAGTSCSKMTAYCSAAAAMPVIRSIDRAAAERNSPTFHNIARTSGVFSRNNFGLQRRADLDEEKRRSKDKRGGRQTVSVVEIAGHPPGPAISHVLRNRDLRSREQERIALDFHCCRDE